MDGLSSAASTTSVTSRCPAMATEEQRWDAELDAAASPAPLLQTWAWGEVQAHAGWTIERVRLPSGAGLASVQIRTVRGARDGYGPAGPGAATRGELAE